jgi:hypothetical protein
MQAYSELSGSLKDKNIAISISDSEDIHDYGGDDVLLRDVTIELSRHILVAGGKLIYGGDLRAQGFTELFADLSCQYGQKEKSDRNTKYFTNYFAWPIYLNMTKTHESDFEHSRVSIVKIEAPDECPPDSKDTFIAPTTPENNYLWAKSLSKMRGQMENNSDARIILGGRTHGFKGKYAGILEEYLIAKNKGNPIYLLGGFGGVSKIIADMLEEKLPESHLSDQANIDASYSDFVSYYNTKENSNPINYQAIFSDISHEGIASLNNGLSEDENKILFQSTNILEIVALVLKGLNNKFKTI